MTIAHNRAIICAEKKPGAVILRKILGFLLVLSLLLACCAAPPEGPEARVRRADELLSRWSMELYCGCHWDGEYAAQEGLYVAMLRRVESRARLDSGAALRRIEECFSGSGVRVVLTSGPLGAAR